MSRWSRSIGAIAVCFGTTVLGFSQQPATPSQQAPVFRGGTFVVPVDVRVLDSKGRPIMGLTQKDFTIVEDEVPQEIRQFSVVNLKAAPDAPPQPLVRARSGATPEAQNRRIFLIVLGRGANPRAFTTMPDLLAFVRTRLMPQDHVAINAFNRATDFTTNRELIANILERYAERGRDIEFKMTQTATPNYLPSVYGIRNLSEKIQTDINWIFDVPGAPTTRVLPFASIPNRDRIAGDQRDAINASAPGADKLAREMFEIGFMDFNASFQDTLDDLHSVYRGIEYLRNIDGEKHLVMVVGQPMMLPRFEDDSSLASVAADARVAVDIIQTGGLPGSADPQTMLRSQPSFASLFAGTAAKYVATETGGQASLYRYAREGLKSIADATESGYLLGYAPTNGDWNGKYRRITVKVNRPGATVLYRHGYFGRQELTPFNRRAALTYTRMAGATNLPGDVRDIKVDLDAKVIRDKQGWAVEVRTRVDPSRLTWTLTGNERSAEIDIGVFCAGDDEKSIGEHLQREIVKFDAAQFEKTTIAGISNALTVRVDKAPKYVRVVVYDYGADLVGTASMRLR
jgi:VWFA-related protein